MLDCARLVIGCLFFVTPRHSSCAGRLFLPPRHEALGGCFQIVGRFFLQCPMRCHANARRAKVRGLGYANRYINFSTAVLTVLKLTFGAAAVISKAISDYVYASEPPVAIDFNATFSSRRITLSLSNAGDSDLIFSKFIVCEPNIPVASAGQSGNEDIFPRYRYSGTTYLKPGETIAPNYDFWTYHDDDEMTERVSRTNH